MIIPVILCGGSGTRLWPLSRNDNPKQFLRFEKKFSLFQETVKRFNNKAIFTNPIIVGQEQHKFKISGELEEIGVKPQAIILEPCAKNTAPAIAAAALVAQQQINDSQTLLILPSDHVIENVEEFVSCVARFQNFTKEKLITFGITPSHAATGYGYIRLGKQLDDGINEIQSFVEKPNAEKAEEFLETGEFLWNSGIFLLDASLYLQELEAFERDIFINVRDAVNKMEKNILHHGSFSKAKNLSVDYAVFEKTKKAAVCPIKLEWTDLGSWNSFYEYMKSSTNAENNILVGQNTHAFNCNNNLFYAQNGPKLVVNSMNDLAVICTQDVVFITSRTKSEETKNIYAQLKANKIDITNNTSKCYRPWGYFEVILKEANYSVKRICIFPLQEISLQYHNKRNEHWVITKGLATVRKKDEILLLQTNQSVYINAGEIHKISNSTNENLEFIEVQTGELIDENDIVRIEDKYGRLVLQD